MAIDVSSQFEDPRLAQLVPSKMARGLQGSKILAIAAHVKRLIAEGHTVSNFTIGDFNTSMFPIPAALSSGITEMLEAGQTSYPPAMGVPELRAAVRAYYKRHLGLDYPEGTVQVGSGARPPIYAAFECLVEPGDVVVYPVPTWNIRYYVYMNQAEGVPLVTHPENGFMPTAEQLLPHIERAQVLVLNSPLNPCGTTISEALLTDISEAILAENAKRLRAGRRPLMLIFDQVYWQLTFGAHKHHTPVGLRPEIAKYTVLVDAISKSWAATGIRVGWAVVPPYLRDRMKALVGHMGAWAGRPEQLATAKLLNDDLTVDAYMVPFKGQLQRRLRVLQEGLLAMKAEGLPVDCLDAQGAIYLSARFDLEGRTLRGRTIQGDESMRSLLLEEAGVAVVPFTAFGYPEGTGWVRFSVGSVSLPEVTAALARIRDLLTSAEA